MPSIRVSDPTYRAIAQLAILPFRSTATRQPDNTWLVPVDPDVHAAIEAQRLPGESNDDAIQRLLHQHQGRPLN